MTLTLNPNCASIYIESDLISDYIAALPTPLTSLALEITVGTGTSFTIQLDDTNLDLINERYELVPEDLSQVDAIPDGIYYLELTETTLSTDDDVVEAGCIFVDCATKCALITYLAENLDNPYGIHILYEALTYVGSCSECSCSDAAVIWDRLNEILNDTINTSNCANCG